MDRARCPRGQPRQHVGVRADPGARRHHGGDHHRGHGAASASVSSNWRPTGPAPRSWARSSTSSPSPTHPTRAAPGGTARRTDDQPIWWITRVSSVYRGSCWRSRALCPEAIRSTRSDPTGTTAVSHATQPRPRPPARTGRGQVGSFDPVVCGCGPALRRHDPGGLGPPPKTSLHVEAELHHVAVDGVVVLALDADLADLLGLRPRADVEQLVPAG